MNDAFEAPGALGLVLAGHDHVWTERERQLCEAATSFGFRKGSGLSASMRYLQPTPLTGLQPESVQFERDDPGGCVAVR